LFDVDVEVTQHGVSPLQEEFKKWMKENCDFECGQSNYPLMKVDHRLTNGFVAAAFLAYNKHYKFELSVDDFWVAIAQGISKHINGNSEKYRSLFVSHEGKKTLDLPVDPLGIKPKSAGNANKWPQAINMMAKLIQKDIKADLVTTLTTPFSTTGSVEETVFNCTLMDSLKSYYDYKFSLCCGIPEVTLLGKPEDFQSILDRVNELAALIPDFNWWFDSIRPHLNKLLDTAAGNPDVEWWSTICHSVGGGSDISMLSGWLADFIPYVDDGKGGYSKARRDHDHYTQGLINGIDFKDLTEAVVLTDFTLDDNGHNYPMKLVSGFLGISQNPETFALRPSMGWITVYT